MGGSANPAAAIGLAGATGLPGRRRAYESGNCNSVEALAPDRSTLAAALFGVAHAEIGKGCAAARMYSKDSCQQSCRCGGSHTAQHTSGCDTLEQPKHGTKAQGLSEATAQRIWHRYGLKPHLVQSFKLSRDREFVEKFHDVVGLCLNPRDKAVVLCRHQKSQIQALERTQPMLPLRPGHGSKRARPSRRLG